MMPLWLEQGSRALLLPTVWLSDIRRLSSLSRYAQARQSHNPLPSHACTPCRPFHFSFYKNEWLFLLRLCYPVVLIIQGFKRSSKASACCPPRFFHASLRRRTRGGGSNKFPANTRLLSTTYSETQAAAGCSGKFRLL